MFPPIWLYLGIAVALSIGGWIGVKSLEERGAAKVRAEVERQASEATIDAHEHRLRAEQQLEAVEREQAAKVSAMETELKELRDARGQGGDPVVFDERWADWVRGKRGDRPGTRPLGDQGPAGAARRH